MFRKSDQKGQSMVEVAIAMPLLILIVAGILDLGRAYFTFVTISDAAAEGAAYAALHPTETTQIIERASDASNGLVQLEYDMISIQSGAVTPGNAITVTVEFEYELLTPIIREFVPGDSIKLKSTVSQSIMSGGF
jgi:Flp pilus assembly protein TadG